MDVSSPLQHSDGPTACLSCPCPHPNHWRYTELTHGDPQSEPCGCPCHDEWHFRQEYPVPVGEALERLTVLAELQADAKETQP